MSQPLISKDSEVSYGTTRQAAASSNLADGVSPNREAEFDADLELAR